MNVPTEIDDTEIDDTEIDDTEIDEFSKHELLDRIHSISVMFDQLVVEHHAASLMQKDIDRAAEMLAGLFQKAGSIRFQ